MVGIGCDIERVQRFKKILKNKRFLSNVFTDGEIKYCFRKKHPEVYLAEKFVGKEAIFKAISSLGESVPLKFIEILNKNKIGNTARLLCKTMNKNYRISVDYARIKENIVFATSIAERVAQ